MIKKQGITIVMMAITIVILTILAATITISSYSTINYSRLSTWVTEITNIQDVVDEEMGKSSVMDYTLDNITINVGSLIGDEQFVGETISNDGILTLKILDLGKLKITNTRYGNLDTAQDVYAVSEQTGRVYYVQGIEADDTIYYTLTETVRNRFDLPAVENELPSIVFVPSALGYTNQPITAKVKVPSSYTNIVVSTSNANIQIGAQTLKGTIYEYEVNTNKFEGNYTIIVSYNDGTQNLESRYEINGYDVTAPTINSITDANFVYVERDAAEYITNITANDESGIKMMKYTVGEITEADGKDYFKDKGNIIIDGKIKLNITDTVYTLYAEDNAGNFSTKVVDVTEKSFAIYSESDNSLTFVRTSRKLKKGEVYGGKQITDLYTGFETTSYDNSKTFTPWYNNRDKILSVKFEDVISPNDTKYWFDGLINCTNLEVANLDISKVQSMSYMFRNAGSSNTVTEFHIVGTDDWNTKSVKYMVGVFKYAGQNATTWSVGDLSNWDISNVNNIREMFSRAGQNATKWNVGQLNSWNVSNVQDMSTMFYYAANKAEEFNIGNLNNWDVSLVQTMEKMFNFAGENASAWNIGDLSNWKTTKLKSMNQTFKSAGKKATKWNIGNIGNWNVSLVTDMYQLFQNAGQQATEWNVGNLSSWNVASVENMAGMFSHACTNASTFNIGNLDNWNTSSVKDMSYMFQEVGLKATTWNIGILDLWNVSNVNNMAGMFANAAGACKEFNIGTLQSWDTSQVTDMRVMFTETGKNADYYMDLSGWNVELVTLYAGFNDYVKTKVIAPNFK